MPPRSSRSAPGRERCKVLYVWSTLLSGPQGQSIMIDTVSWIVNATLRPPRPSFGALRWPDTTHVAFNFNAQSNLDYVVQSRVSLSAGMLGQAAGSIERATNRSLWITNSSPERAPRTFASPSGHSSRRDQKARPLFPEETRGRGGNSPKQRPSGWRVAWTIRSMTSARKAARLGSA